MNGDCKVGELWQLVPQIVFDALQVTPSFRAAVPVMRNLDLYRIAEYASAAVIGLAPLCGASFVAERYPYLNPGSGNRCYPEMHLNCELADDASSVHAEGNETVARKPERAGHVPATSSVLPHGYPLCFSAVAPWS